MGEKRRLSWETGAPRSSIGLLFQLVVPLAALDALQLSLQLLISLFVGPDLLGDSGAVARVQLVDELRNEVLVLDGFVDRGQARTGCLPLARGLDVSILDLAVHGALLALDLLLQDVQVEVAQGIGAQTAALEAPVGGDVGIVLQQLRDSAEDVGPEAIGMERLEQE